MTGGLLQLKFKGSQDKFLTTNPKISFFKTTYKKYTNFSIETRDEKFINNCDFGKTVILTIPRLGDLMSRMCLIVELPKLSDSIFKWTKSIGHVLIDFVEIEIGGNVIDKQYGEWMHIWNQLFMRLYTILSQRYYRCLLMVWTSVQRIHR